MHQSAEGLAVNDSVVIPLKAGSNILIRRNFRSGTAAALIGKGGKGIESAVLLVFQLFSDCHDFPSCEMGNARYSWPVSIPSTVPEVMSVSRSRKGWV